MARGVKRSRAIQAEPVSGDLARCIVGGMAKARLGITLLLACNSVLACGASAAGKHVIHEPQVVTTAQGSTNACQHPPPGYACDVLRKRDRLGVAEAEILRPERKRRPR